MDCIFCKIIQGELPSSKVYEDRAFLAFMDIQPVNPGHVLIIPKRHAASLAELDDQTLAVMISLANRINRALRKTNLKVDGVNLLLADGEAAGQEVFHVHLHVIPRFCDDGFGFTFSENYDKKPTRLLLDVLSKEVASFLE